MKARLESDSTRPPPGPTGPCPRSDPETQLRPLIRPSVAYEIAASAASYVHSRAKGLLSLGGEPGTTNGGERLGEGQEEALSPKETLGQETLGEGPEEAQSPRGSPGRVYKSNVAAYVARSTMTAVVAAEEEARQEAAKDLRSLHSSPCEWFVCDDPSTTTRCFVIQVGWIRQLPLHLSCTTLLPLLFIILLLTVRRNGRVRIRWLPGKPTCSSNPPNLR